VALVPLVRERDTGRHSEEAAELLHVACCTLGGGRGSVQPTSLPREYCARPRAVARVRTLGASAFHAPSMGTQAGYDQLVSVRGTNIDGTQLAILGIF
jgi:hypothetical protein